LPLPVEAGLTEAVAELPDAEEVENLPPLGVVVKLDGAGAGDLTLHKIAL
jgi:hypothetical protein